MVLNEVMDDLYVLFVPTEVPKKTKEEANHTTPIATVPAHQDPK